eukprot:5778825-Lingulodinium_polyedra.AAC.1
MVALPRSQCGLAALRDPSRVGHALLRCSLSGEVVQLSGCWAVKYSKEGGAICNRMASHSSGCDICCRAPSSATAR